MDPIESRLSPYLKSADESSTTPKSRTLKPSTDKEVLVVDTLPMAESNIDEIMPIEETGFDNPYSPYGICELLQDGKHFGLLAQNDNEEAVGYAIVEIRNNCLAIISLAVAEEHRGKMVGTQLVNMIVSLARIRCKKIVETVIRESNKEAQKFFVKQKFDLVKEAEKVYNIYPNEPACTYERYMPQTGFPEDIWKGRDLRPSLN